MHDSRTGILKNSSTYTRPPLPIDAVLPQLLSTLCAHSAVVLCAPPGSGKTTRVPLALLTEIDERQGNIILLEPRRIAARAVATFMAGELNEKVGETVGYQIRFDKKIGPSTRIHVVTEGILTRRFLNDPFLEGTACVIIDEFHERSINVDLALCLLKETLTVRSDLRVIVMSATIDAQEVSRYLNQCPVLNVTERPFLLSTVFSTQRFTHSSTEHLVRQITHMTKRAIAENESGDILVFLPGAYEIEQTHKSLAATLSPSIEIYPLYGALSQLEQDRVFTLGTRRRIVLATNIAETSLTIPNISIVVDSGLEKRLEWRSSIGFEKLVTGFISRFSATQRAGRAARIRPGTVYRLWTEAQHNELPVQSVPEIHRTDPLHIVFTLVRAFHRSPDEVDLLTPLPQTTTQRAVDTLRVLQLIRPDSFRLTSLGAQLAEFPLHPRAALIVAASKSNGQIEEGILAAALLSERDIFRTRQIPNNFNEQCDIRLRITQFRLFQQSDQSEKTANQMGLHRHACSSVIKMQQQIRSLANSLPIHNSLSYKNFLFPGFIDRVCKQTNVIDGTAIMATGRGVLLSKTSSVRAAPFFIALNGDASNRLDESRSAISLASEVSIDDLKQSAPHAITVTNEVQFDNQSQKVIARETTRFLSLVLSIRLLPKVPTEKQAEVLLQQLINQWQVRLLNTFQKQNAFARWVFAAKQNLTSTTIPTTEPEIIPLLQPYCQSATRLTDLFNIDLPSVIENQLPFDIRRNILRLVPIDIRLPSGRNVPIDYTRWKETGTAPLIRVKLQELFGMTDTPTIGIPPVPLSIALLSPSGREVQITTDLNSFWTNTYPEVRKELRARYAKHFWPENPFDAQATHLTKKQFAKKKQL